MQGFIRVSAILTAALLASAVCAEEITEQTELIVSVAEQRLLVVRDGMWVQKYPVSTSKFGEGDSYGSYKTPLGRLRVCGKIGAGLPVGAVMQHRHATGEILQVNARGRDPIVTRILWLEGLEPQNERARSRGIYIHGTVEESKIGKPVSYGCVRMRSHDVIELFDMVPTGTIVTIQQAKLPRLKRWTPRPPTHLLVSKEPVKPVTKTAAREEEKKPAPEVEKKELVRLAEKEAQREKQKEPVRLVAVAAPKHERATREIPEKPERAVREVPEKSLSFASAKPTVTTRTPLVIRSSGWAEEARMVPADAGAAMSLKGSILFSDLPGE